MAGCGHGGGRAATRCRTSDRCVGDLRRPDSARAGRLSRAGRRRRGAAAADPARAARPWDLAGFVDLDLRHRPRAGLLHRHRVRAVRSPADPPGHLRRRPLRQAAPARSAGWTFPRVGFGFGDVVLGELLKDRGLVPARRSGIDVFIAARDGRRRAPRARRWRTSCAMPASASNTRWAARRWASSSSWPTAGNARVAIVIGPDDRARGEVMLKDLQGRPSSR